MRCFALVSFALSAQIPITNEVIFDGKSLGTGSDLSPLMGQCNTGSYTHTDPGILPKGGSVTVKGSDVKVELHMRGRCESYHSYDYTVGGCDPKLGGAAGETPTETFTADHPVQSYKITQC